MLLSTIRDVLWLTVVVGTGIGWWLEYKDRGPENVKLRKENSLLLSQNQQSKDDYDELMSTVKKTDIELVRENLKLHLEVLNLKYGPGTPDDMAGWWKRGGP